MTIRRIRVVVVCAMVLAAFRCARKEPAGAPKREQAAAVQAPKAVEEKPQPYTYPAPVKGSFKEINIGSFGVVDGIAYKGGAGTVVSVTSKPIASPVLAGSPCPMTAARSAIALRNASFLEVTLDTAGRSRYFVAGNAFGGSSREEASGSRSWSSKLRAASGRAAGSVRHTHGGFEFDLPVLTPAAAEVSQGDWVEGKRSNPAIPRPAEQAVTAAYRAAHAAALKRDWKALAAAIGFDEKESAAIRGLEGIDADFAVYADRFLSPGNPGEFTPQAGTAYVRGEGTNSKGKKFANFYHFVPCSDRLVLVSIAENPQ
jgi:hypothetical protein